MFGGRRLAGSIEGFLMEPCNTISMESNMHRSLGKLEWGIEVTEENGDRKYVCRAMENFPQSSLFPTLEGRVVTFNRDPAEEDIRPHPHLCNLYLAVCRLVSMSDAAEVLDAMFQDDDEDIVPCLGLSHNGDELFLDGLGHSLARIY
ncbi:hypothetical protein FRB93_008927 [Tulasnella sp. JGI-2019a]|nr:hypothetical protein FRB93_008927 [Tulasnella sp. JGI-2019a]